MTDRTAPPILLRPFLVFAAIFVLIAAALVGTASSSEARVSGASIWHHPKSERSTVSIVCNVKGKQQYQTVKRGVQTIFDKGTCLDVDKFFVPKGCTANEAAGYWGNRWYTLGNWKQATIRFRC